MAPASIEDLPLSASLRVSFLIMCGSMLTTWVGATEVSMTVNNVPQTPVQAVHHESFQNGIVGPPTVTILSENAERKCKHCQPFEKDSDKFEEDDDDNDRYQDGDGDENDDDDDVNENGVELVDQRQNGTENYRIRVSGLLLIITPPELPMPTPSTESPPLIPPTPPSNSTDGTLSVNGIKKRFNVRRNGQNINEQEKRKLSKYQARIPQFIMSLLRSRRIAQQRNQ